MIKKYLVTDASVQDSQATDELLDEKDRGKSFYADSAYTGEPQEKIIKKKGMGTVYAKRATATNP